MMMMMVMMVNGIVIAGDMNGSIAEAPAEIILEAGFKSADPMQQVRRTFVGWPAYGDYASGIYSRTCKRILSLGVWRRDAK